MSTGNCPHFVARPFHFSPGFRSWSARPTSRRRPLREPDRVSPARGEIHWGCAAKVSLMKTKSVSRMIFSWSSERPSRRISRSSRPVDRPFAWPWPAASGSGCAALRLCAPSRRSFRRERPRTAERKRECATTGDGREGRSSS